MIKIKSTEEALKVFEESTVIHAECTETGNYKKGNKANDRAMKAADYLKKHGQLLKLKHFFTHSHVGPKKWAAIKLLPIVEEESLKVLSEISKGRGGNAFTAEIALEEWAKPDSEMRKSLTKPTETRRSQ